MPTPEFRSPYDPTAASVMFDPWRLDRDALRALAESAPFGVPTLTDAGGPARVAIVLLADVIDADAPLVVLIHDDDGDGMRQNVRAMLRAPTVVQIRFVALYADGTALARASRVSTWAGGSGSPT